MATLKQLQYFIVVAEERHFRHAADRLKIAQPGLSQQIKALEETVGVQLLLRDRRNVELTPAGEVFLKDARVIIDLVDRAVASARSAASGTSGSLRIGTRALGWDEALTRLIDEYSRRRPDVTVEFVPAMLGEGLTQLQRGVVDIAVILRPFEEPGAMNYLPLTEIEPLVVLPVGHPLAMSEHITRDQLEDETILGPPRTFGPGVYDRLMSWIFGDHVPRSYVETPDLAAENRLRRVANGEGITIVVSPSAVALNVPDLVFRPLAEPVPKLEYGLAWVDRDPSSLVASFVDVAREWHATERND